MLGSIITPILTLTLPGAGVWDKLLRELSSLYASALDWIRLDSHGRHSLFHLRFGYRRGMEFGTNCLLLSAVAHRASVSTSLHLHVYKAGAE